MVVSCSHHNSSVRHDHWPENNEYCMLQTHNTTGENKDSRNHQSSFIHNTFSVCNSLFGVLQLLHDPVRALVDVNGLHAYGEAFVPRRGDAVAPGQALWWPLLGDGAGGGVRVCPVMGGALPLPPVPRVQAGLGRPGGEGQVADGAVPLRRDALHVLLEQIPLLSDELQLGLEQSDGALLVIKLLRPHGGQGARRVDTGEAKMVDDLKRKSPSHLWPSLVSDMRSLSRSLSQSLSLMSLSRPPLVSPILAWSLASGLYPLSQHSLFGLSMFILTEWIYKTWMLFIRQCRGKWTDGSTLITFGQIRARQTNTITEKVDSKSRDHAITVTSGVSRCQIINQTPLHCKIRDYNQWKQIKSQTDKLK